jgi:hypothetical protein
MYNKQETGCMNEWVRFKWAGRWFLPVVILVFCMVSAAV